MSERVPPTCLRAADVPPRDQPSIYPEPYASRMQGRTKRVLGDRFGLVDFGVNLTTLAPGAVSALRHFHTRQDEFVYILEGTPVLVTDSGETLLGPGMCAGFRAGSGVAHQLVNRSAEPVVYLEVGDRAAGDEVVYPEDDLAAVFEEGRWRFTRKDGSGFDPAPLPG